MDSSLGIRFWDALTLVLYFLITLGIGFYSYKKLKGTEGYFVGGRSMPGWAVGISMLGTAISSVTFLAYPGSAYAGNWSLLVPGLMVPVAVIFAAFLFVPYYRRANLVSVNEYLELRFAPWARVYSCIMWSIHSFIRMGIILFLLSLPVRSITGWDIYFIIIVLGVLVTLYTVIGGIEAVIWTDVLQTLVLIFGGIVCITIVWNNVDGGFAAIFAEAWTNDKFDLSASLSTSIVEETLLVLVLYGLFQNLQEFAADQTRVQRYCAPHSDRAAIKSVLLGGLGCIPVWMLFMFVGTCLWVFYQHFPDQLSADIINQDEVFPHFILSQLPLGMGGFVIAAVMAAAMSSIDSSMNGTATVLTTDIYKRFFVKGRDDASYLKTARIITTIAGVWMVLFASFVAYIVTNDILPRGTILDIAFFFYSVVAGGIGGMFFLGFLTTRTNSRGVAIGIVLAVMVTFYLTFSVFDMLPEGYNSPTHRFMINVFSNTISFIVGYFCSSLFPQAGDEKLTNLTWWTYTKEPS